MAQRAVEATHGLGWGPHCPRLRVGQEILTSARPLASPASQPEGNIVCFYHLDIGQGRAERDSDQRGPEYKHYQRKNDILSSLHQTTATM